MEILSRYTDQLPGVWKECVQRRVEGWGEETTYISKASQARGSVNTNEIELMRILKHKAVHTGSDHLAVHNHILAAGSSSSSQEY